MSSSETLAFFKSFFGPSSLYVQVHLFQGHLINQILREVSTDLVVSLFCFLSAKSQIGRFSVGVYRQTVPRFALQPYLNPELASPLPPHTGVT